MQEEENVILDTSNETEETVETPIDTTEESEVDIEQLRATNKKLFERAKKAEAEAKALKGITSKPAQPQQTPSVDIDERILKSQGMSDELLSELRVIAALRGVSVIDAQSDHLFVATKEKFDKDSKSKAASMGASRGSGKVQPKKDFASPSLSREEHMQMIKEANIRL